jgi:hypothetical protein
MKEYCQTLHNVIEVEERRHHSYLVITVAPTCILTVLRYQTPTPCVHQTVKFRTAEQFSLA